jgi:phosphatidylserine decarboxylase
MLERLSESALKSIYSYAHKFRIHSQFQVRGSEVKKGEELGFFQFGASSITVALQNGRIRFDDDLAQLSKQRIMVAVEVGMSLGEAAKET